MSKLLIHSTLKSVFEKNFMCKRVWCEMIVAARFGIVGIVATVVHIMVVWLLLTVTVLSPLVANTLAFLTAFGVSFSGHYRWTFGAPGNPGRAMKRFLLISVSAFAMNTLLLAFLVRGEWLSPVIAAIFSASGVPLFTFIASRFWGFQNKEGDCMITAISTKRMEMLVSILPLVLGAIAFFIVVGPRALNPMNIAWLGSGDPATHYLGWSFFRDSPWTFPVGMNPGYGLELSSAIIYSDSNPLFAFLFKPFSPLLPHPFQYFGIWLLLCFCLQAWFGWKLMGLISSSVMIRLLGAGFFVFAPPMIRRMGGHLSLGGHFLIIAALYLAFNDKPENRRYAWGTLLAVAALVHAYLLAMVALIWIADLGGRVSKKYLSNRSCTIEFSVLVAVVWFVCWQAGYFSIGSGVVAGGYGISYMMNLVSIFDSIDWSYVLKNIPGVPGTHERFNYLGLGVIFLLVLALPVLISGRAGLIKVIRKRLHLLVLLLAFSVFAISNNVGFGSLQWHYDLPEYILKAANVFRASGRMFWPVFYVIIFTTIFLVVRGYEKRTAAALLGLALVLQVVDTNAGWSVNRKIMMTKPASEWSTKLTDPFWAEAAIKYAKVRYIPIGNHSSEWLHLSYYASVHGLKTDAVYLARTGKRASRDARKKGNEILKSGNFEPDSLYILRETAFHQAALTADGKSTLFAKIDGLNVIAPGWKNCAECRRVENELNPDDLPPFSLTWKGCELPTKIGEKTAACEMQKRDKTLSGSLTFGPYEPLLSGHYTFEIAYASTDGVADVVGDFDVTFNGGKDILKNGLMTGTNGTTNEIKGEFVLDSEYDMAHVEIRTSARQNMDLKVIAIKITQARK
jgi:putative flippase GtrA